MGLYLLVVVGLVGVNFWLGYDIDRNVLAIQSNKREIITYAYSTEQQASLKADAGRARVERVFLENILPQQDGLINFPRDISALAKQNNVESAFQFGGQVTGNETTPGYINFNLVVSGALNNWLQFLETLEKSRYLISFDSFNIAADNKKYRFNVNGKVFSQ